MYKINCKLRSYHFYICLASLWECINSIRLEYDEKYRIEMAGLILLFISEEQEIPLIESEFSGNAEIHWIAMMISN